ncbi:protein anon-37Cs-like [Physella acuta]|uniref:protein anon-37Cs-like n=1 Tax=Physella acuta TaxID=109671 RepID=UPI0027DC5441|nr:protein anon-37Cs-like [Physella acuta]
MNLFLKRNKKKQRFTGVTLPLLSTSPQRLRTFTYHPCKQFNPKKNINAYRLHKMLYTQEKHEQVLQSLKDLKEKKFEQAMLKQELREVCSQRKRKEAVFKRQAITERLEWHFGEKRKILSEIKILIIGGGMAGLSAANRLLALGYRNVKILEASNRLGGRIKRFDFGKNSHDFVELGVETFLAGSSSSSIDSLALQNNVVLKPVDEARIVSILNSKGDEISTRSIHRGMRIFNQMETQGELIYTHIADSSDTVNLSYANFFREKLRRLHGGNHKQAIAVRDAFTCLYDESRRALGDSAGNSAVQWFSHNNSRLPRGANRVKIPDSMSSLVHCLTKQFKPDAVCFKAKVVRVDWSMKMKESTVQVECAHGQTFTANHVIVAVPLGVLKKHHASIFSPELPKEKVKVIENVGFGSVSKLFVFFHKSNVFSPFSLLWRKAAPTSPEGSVTLNIRTLKRCIVEVSSLGSYLEDVSETEIVEELVQVLSVFLQKPLPYPERFIRSNWHRDSLFYGTHPYLTTSCTLADFQLLAKPLVTHRNLPAVLFAGDYTYDNYSNLLDAARRSGLREAERINQLYNKYFGYENTNP